jgi:hypothetical protein
MRDYLDNRRWRANPAWAPGDVVTAPTAVAVSRTCSFPEGEPAREWAERLYNVCRWSVMARGGRFAPAEEP